MTGENVTPLIITATANTCWMHPEVDYPRIPRDIAAEAALCLENGAAVCHTHAEGRWKEVIPAIGGSAAPSSSAACPAPPWRSARTSSRSRPT